MVILVGSVCVLVNTVLGVLILPHMRWIIDHETLILLQRTWNF